MARPASVAVGGYFPTPTHLIPHMAALIGTAACFAPARYGRAGSYALLDPCAGDGTAILQLYKALFIDRRAAHDPGTGTGTGNSQPAPEVSLYTAEMEAGRAAALKAQVAQVRTLPYNARDLALHTDAFRVAWSTSTAGIRHSDAYSYSYGNSGISVMLLNPPYDALSKLEEQFLRRFTPILTPGTGILLGIFPAQTVARDSAWIAAHYDDISVWRFPDPDFDAFKQVVVIAYRAAQPRTVDPHIHAARSLHESALAPHELPVLPPPGTRPPVLSLPAQGNDGLREWRAVPMDLLAVRAAARPWQETAGRSLRYVPGVGFEGGIEALRAPNLTMPLPPRPGYIALAMSVGIFDGQQLLPNDGASGLPPVLIRATFTAEYVQTDTNLDKEGNVKAVVEVQQPQLRVCVLDMRAGVYHTLQAGNEATGAGTLAEMNVIDLIEAYSVAMSAVLRERVPTLHDPQDPSHRLPLPALHGRTLFRAQEAAVMAALKLMQQGQNVFVLGDVGAGKTTVAASILWSLAPGHWGALQQALGAQGFAGAPSRLKQVRRVLVVMPPHLPPMWRQELGRMLPGARLHLLDSLTAVARMSQDQGAVSIGPDGAEQPGSGLVIGLLSRESAKLGSELAPGIDALSPLRPLRPLPLCPRCGAQVEETADVVVRRRLRCKGRTLSARHPLGRIAQRLAYLLAPAYPGDSDVRTLVSGRYAQQSMNKVMLVRARPGHSASSAPDVPVGEAGDLDPSPNTAGPDPQGATSLASSAQTQNEVIAGAWRANCPHDTPWEQTPLASIIRSLTAYIGRYYNDSTRANDDTLRELMKILSRLFLSTGHPEREDALSRVARELFVLSLNDKESYGKGSVLRKEICTLLVSGRSPRNGVIAETVASLRSALIIENNYDSPWSDYDRKQQGWDEDAPEPDHVRWYWSTMRLGDPDHAKEALRWLMVHGHLGLERTCGEPLWQLTGRPRRYPLATYIARYYPQLAQLLVIDEAHDYRNADSAQTHAVERLIALGWPVLKLTGTVSDGKARSLFTTLWSMSPAFREEFGFGEEEEFVRRYGYIVRTRKVDDEDGDDGDVRSFGSHTDRVESGVKTGEAPGVRPDLLLRHLLPLAVTIARTDLEVDLPAPVQVPCPIEISREDVTGMTLRRRVTALQEAVLAQIARDRFQPGLAGKLWGALASLPAAWDLMTVDTGNRTDLGEPPGYRVSYPSNVGGALVAAAEPLPSDVLLPKERRLIEILNDELAEGRNVMVWAWHTGAGVGTGAVGSKGALTGLLSRLRRIIREHTGHDPLVLESAKVPPIKRQDWIDAECIGKGKRILICHPQTVSTGLNNLVWFQSGVWYENPGYSAISAQQAVGRIWRPGMDASRPLRVYWLNYEDSLQALAYRLTLQKIAAAQQAQGQDWRATLAAAGLVAADEGALDSMAIGQRLYEMLEAEGAQATVAVEATATATAITTTELTPAHMKVVAGSRGGTGRSSKGHAHPGARPQDPDLELSRAG